MTRAMLEQIIRGTPPGLKNAELKTFDVKLKHSVDQKVKEGSLSFSSPSSSASINLSQFGLQNSDDIRKFLLTPAGDTVKGQISERIALDKALKEEQLVQLQEALLIQEQQRSLLFHWLMEDEEAHAGELQKELMDLQQNQKIKNTKTKSSTSNKLFETVVQYDDKLGRLLGHHNELSDQLDQLREEQNLLEEKYQVYQDSLEEFDRLSGQYETYTEEELQTELDQFKSEAQGLADELSTTEDEQEARQLLNKLNAKNLNIVALQDIMDKQKGKKTFFDENGTSVDSYKKAAFVLSNEQKIVKDKDGQYYLLKAGQQWDDVKKDPKAKAQAKQAFESSKKEIQIVRHAVKDVKAQETAFNATQIAQHKAEQLMVKNQMNLMHSARANAQRALSRQQNNPNPTPNTNLPMQAPTPTVTTASYKFKSAAPIAAAQANTRTVAGYIQTRVQQRQNNQQNYKPTWRDLFQFIKEIPDGQARSNANKYMKDTYKSTTGNSKLVLSEIPRMAPVPEVTMNSMLAHMARFHLNPYKVGNEKSDKIKEEESMKLQPKLTS